MYEDPVRIFYANLRISPDSGELETLVIGTRITLNDFLFEKMFDTKFSGAIPLMNGSWPDEFEVSFKEAKQVVFDPYIASSSFGPLSLCFKYRILAYIIATTLIPKKGSLSNITCHGIFVLYCLVKKYKINWAAWFREYILESTADAHTFSSLSYGLLITRILQYYSIDLSAYPTVEISARYDSKYLQAWDAS